MKSLNTLNILFLLSGGYLIALFLSRSLRKKKEIQEPINQTKVREIFESTFLGKYEPMKRLLFAQAFHETGGFTSRSFKEENNLFGMKVPTRRAFLGKKSTKSAYAKYDNVQDSLKDMIIYLNFVNMPVVVTAEQYARELKVRSYYEDTEINYILGLKNGLTKY